MSRERRSNEGIVCGVMFLFLAFSMVFVLEPSSATAQVKPIKIGYLTPRTGLSASNAKDMIDAMSMCVDEFGGKIAGRPIQVIVEDTEGKPAVGLVKARKLIIEDGCQMIAGPIYGHVSNAVSPFINEQKIPWLTLAASPADLTLQKLTPWIIRTNFSGPQRVIPSASMLIK